MLSSVRLANLDSLKITEALLDKVVSSPENRTNANLRIISQELCDGSLWTSPPWNRVVTVQHRSLSENYLDFLGFRVPYTLPIGLCCGLRHSPWRYSDMSPCVIHDLCSKQDWENWVTYVCVRRAVTIVASAFIRDQIVSLIDIAADWVVFISHDRITILKLASPIE